MCAGFGGEDCVREGSRGQRTTRLTFSLVGFVSLRLALGMIQFGLIWFRFHGSPAANVSAAKWLTNPVYHRLRSSSRDFSMARARC